MVEIPEKIKMIKKIREFIVNNNLDGYLIPKNDSYFTEFSNINNLEKISKFSGSAGFAIILKKLNYLFVDGRYTLQAKQQAGKYFKIFEIPYTFPKNLSNIENTKIGFDPKLFTEDTLEKYFGNKASLIPIEYKFNNKIKKVNNLFFKLSNSVVGEDMSSKVKRVKKYLLKNKINYFYFSASENVNWLMNIRGKDLPNSPLANCKLILTDKGKMYFFSNLIKVLNLRKAKIRNLKFYGEDHIFQIISNLKIGTFGVDKNTCSVFYSKIIESRFKVITKIDPIYNLKSIKNSTEIKNTIKSHIEDGIALTKFLYWFKTNNQVTSEKIIEKKLEKFRRRSRNYLYPSFDTIAGSGPNGSIIHYRSNDKTNRTLKKNDILLLDSGGQYKWGTTDVTRTTCKGTIPLELKNNFTRVLKGHIAVVTCNLKKKINGLLVDRMARKYLNDAGLDYSHGTGHGVGFFLNVHEGPQSISKYNKIKLKKGMILSNEPGYYLENYYGIRIENLIYIDRIKSNLIFKNLTLAPIDLDMINFKMLNNKERNYLFNYHLEVYSKISKYLNNSEKKWLVNLIK